jgi:hypothetical protein
MLDNDILRAFDLSVGRERSGLDRKALLAVTADGGVLGRLDRLTRELAFLFRGGVR